MRKKSDGQVVSGFCDPIGLAPECMGAEMMPVGVAKNLGFNK